MATDPVKSACVGGQADQEFEKSSIALAPISANVINKEAGLTGESTMTDSGKRKRKLPNHLKGYVDENEQPVADEGI